MPARPKSKPAPAPPPTPGHLIRAARERLGLSQRGLAERVGLAQSTIAKLERDHPGQLSVGSTLLLASSLGIEPTALDPALGRHAVTTGRPPRGRVTLVRCAGDGGEFLWTAEGDGIDFGLRVVHDLDVGALVRGLVERGIEVCVPALPPVE
jgi:transcriptional regulator with XRE-family HTH domain